MNRTAAREGLAVPIALERDWSRRYWVIDDGGPSPSPAVASCPLWWGRTIFRGRKTSSASYWLWRGHRSAMFPTVAGPPSA
jgi:hypothetical protein